MLITIISYLIHELKKKNINFQFRFLLYAIIIFDIVILGIFLVLQNSSKDLRLLIMSFQIFLLRIIIYLDFKLLNFPLIKFQISLF